MYRVAVLESVGVPDICPLAVLRDRPAGNPGLIDQVSVLYPPVPEIGINGVTGTATVKDLTDTFTAVTIG